jgi:hypothetical protein
VNATVLSPEPAVGRHRARAGWRLRPGGHARHAAPDAADSDDDLVSSRTAPTAGNDAEPIDSTQ